MKRWYENIGTDSVEIGSIARIIWGSRNAEKDFRKEQSCGLLNYWSERYMNVIQPDKYYLWVEEQVWYFYGWQGEQFDKHEMALMLVDILHSRGLVNDATYRKIMKNTKVCLR